jgi:NAD(P)-dependent dehydrogenase (short-subunit alcohol dehydrogenase family)
MKDLDDCTAPRTPDIRLEDRVVIVTGASRGLGRAMALRLADAGARVVLASPETDLLQRLADEIAARHGAGRALVAATDITIRRECESLVERTIGTFGALHVLVNNARRPHRGPGLPPGGNSLPFWCSDADIWQETVNVNVNGTFLLSHVVTPHLIRQGWGRIIVLTTSLGTMQGRNNSPYGVTKAALEAATLIWAQDLDGTGVTVNSLLPGGSCDSDPDRPPRPGQHLLPVDNHEPGLGLAGLAFVGRQDGRALCRQALELRAAAFRSGLPSARTAGAAPAGLRGKAPPAWIVRQYAASISGSSARSQLVELCSQLARGRVQRSAADF